MAHDNPARTVQARRAAHTAAHDLSAESLEDLERRLIALLYAIWRAQGTDKRIVRGEPDRRNGEGHG